MQPDRTWFVITEIYALIATISLVVIVAGAAYLFLKVKGIVRQTKRRQQALVQQSKDIISDIRDRGRRIASRGRRIGEIAEASAGRIAETMHIESPSAESGASTRLGPLHLLTDWLASRRRPTPSA